MTTDHPSLAPGERIELVVLMPKRRRAHCRVLGTDSEVILQSCDASSMAPGEILTVRIDEHTRRGAQRYVSGEVDDRRIDAAALGPEPLELRDQCTWDPAKDFWVGRGEPLEDWAKQVLAGGPRPSYEMEQIVPGIVWEDWMDDPINDAIARFEAGSVVRARQMLVDLLAQDLRCLDAHAHLGNFAFEQDVELALRHYELGVRIGELSLGAGFDGVLPWDRIDNRPFLRCMHGLGLCLWRSERFEEAGVVFERLLWLNPMDHLCIRIILPQVQAGLRWDECCT